MKIRMKFNGKNDLLVFIYSEKSSKQFSTSISLNSESPSFYMRSLELNDTDIVFQWSVVTTQIIHNTRIKRISFNKYTKFNVLIWLNIANSFIIECKNDFFFESLLFRQEAVILMSGGVYLINRNSTRPPILKWWFITINIMSTGVRYRNIDETVQYISLTNKLMLSIQLDEKNKLV